MWLCYLMLSVININIGKQLAQVDMCQTRLQLCRKGPCGLYSLGCSVVIYFHKALQVTTLMFFALQNCKTIMRKCNFYHAHFEINYVGIAHSLG